MTHVLCFCFALLLLCATEARADQAAVMAKNLRDPAFIKGQAEEAARDYTRAIAEYKTAQHDAFAEFRVAVLYDAGMGAPKDPRTAIEWYQKASADGMTEADNDLAYHYFNGVGTPVSPALSLYWSKKSALDGNAVGMRDTGHFYTCGCYMRPNYDEGAKWLDMAVKHGNRDARLELGDALARNSDPAERQRGLTLLQTMADQEGDTRADNSLGSIYLNGIGVPADPAQAFQWYQKAADRNDMAGQTQVGWMSVHIEPHDYARAIKYDGLAERQGSSMAANNLGYIWENGLGVTGSDDDRYKTALRHYRLSASECFGQAMYHIGHFYEEGLGVPKDPLLARKWMEDGAAYGSPAAAQWLQDQQNPVSSLLSHLDTSPPPKQWGNGYESEKAGSCPLPS